MRRKLLPHPILSLTLLVIWLMLVNKVTVGNVLLGAIFGVIVPILTATYCGLLYTSDAADEAPSCGPGCATSAIENR